MKCKMIIHISTKEASLPSNLAHTKGVTPKQPINCVPLCPPASYKTVTAKFPPKGGGGRH